ncbi:integrase catalytic domain-containing protein [Trichonephila clavipes]|nr:integrase catalytic domain-containing protein [Trichonephila clavipes]
MGIQKRHISSYSAHVNGRVEKPNQSLANILASISQNTNDWDEQLPHTMLALNSAIHEATYTSPFFLEHGRDIRLSYTYEKNSDTPQNKYEYVEKLLPSLEHTFNKVLNNLKDQEASHVELSTRATKQHHYDYKIGSLCFIKTPNIKSNLSPKLRPKFEGPYRVIERFSNVNYRVQHVEQLRKRFNTHVNRMIPFIKRFSYLHLKNLGDLQPDETEVKGIVPGPRYNLRARAANGVENVSSIRFENVGRAFVRTFFVRNPPSRMPSGQGRILFVDWTFCFLVTPFSQGLLPAGSISSGVEFLDVGFLPP